MEVSLDIPQNRGANIDRWDEAFEALYNGSYLNHYAPELDRNIDHNLVLLKNLDLPNNDVGDGKEMYAPLLLKLEVMSEYSTH